MHAMKMPDDDPVLPFVASRFREEVNRAYISLQDGHEDYGKAILRSSVSYCITCHTRTAIGTEFPLIRAFEKPLEKASWIDRLEFQAASRQYDTVLAEVMGKLKEEKSPLVAPMDLERAARTALSIVVRLKKDPDRAALLATTMLESPSSTVSMKEIARAWLKDVRKWQSEKDRNYGGGREYLDEAKRITAEKSLDSEHAEVRHLRASALLHEFLQSGAKGPETAEALYLLGKAYGNLGEIGLWSLNEFYICGLHR